jgi:hypothetical protein
MRRTTIGLAYSACRLCTHGAEAGLELVCTHPALRDPFAGNQPVAVLRAQGGGCGPNADHMQPAYRGQTEAP